MLFGKENKARIVADAFYKKCAGIFLIYKEEETYEMISADTGVKTLISSSGTLDELYEKLLFHMKQTQAQIDSAYSKFISATVFKKNGYEGTVQLQIGGKEKEYELRIFPVSDEINAALLIAREKDKQIDEMQTKMDLLQEDYLYTMLVNLAEDKCYNSAVTELASEGYMDLTYSKWRNMIVDTFAPEDRETFLQISEPKYLMEYLSKNKTMDYNIQMMNLKGNTIWVRMRFNRVKDFSEKAPVFGFSVVNIDFQMRRLLHQKNVLAAVEEENKKIMEDNKSKSLFVADFSHEIRTPLNAITGMSELLVKNCADEKLMSYAKNINVASKMLLETINNILDYSKLEAGMMVLSPVNYSPAEVVSDIVAIYSLNAQNKGLTLEARVSEKIPGELVGDDIRLRQIIVNLLTNAIKYTKQGGVTISADYKSISDSKGLLCVQVADTGIGMKKEDIDHLYDDFVRFNLADNRNVEGTGLGLGIVNKLLGIMNSKLKVSSEVGVGSVFSFEVEQEVGVPSEKPKRQETEERTWDKKKRRILVVDDIETNLRLIEAYLEDYNCEVDLADSGEKCLGFLEQHTYDLILLDHYMPGMDGVATLEKIRANEAWKDLPVIALTATDIQNAKEHYRGLGFKDYLRKPLTMAKFYEMLEEYLK